MLRGACYIRSVGREKGNGHWTLVSSHLLFVTGDRPLVVLSGCIPRRKPLVFSLGHRRTSFLVGP